MDKKDGEKSVRWECETEVNARRVIYQQSTTEWGEKLIGHIERKGNINTRIEGYTEGDVKRGGRCR